MRFIAVGRRRMLGVLSEVFVGVLCSRRHVGWTDKRLIARSCCIYGSERGS